jgi:hypothetical protein
VPPVRRKGVDSLSAGADQNRNAPSAAARKRGIENSSTRSMLHAAGCPSPANHALGFATATTLAPKGEMGTAQASGLRPMKRSQPQQARSPRL